MYHIFDGVESDLKRGGLSSRAVWSVSWPGNGSCWPCDFKPTCLEVSALGILIQDLEMVTVGLDCGALRTVPGSGRAFRESEPATVAGCAG